MKISKNDQEWQILAAVEKTSELKHNITVHMKRREYHLKSAVQEEQYSCEARVLHLSISTSFTALALRARMH